jgi:hypothetical protein
MRILAFLLFIWLSVCGYSQNRPIFLTIQPDASIVVQKHSTGADMVEISMKDPNYPLPLLESQANTICSLLGSPARGLSVTKDAVGGDSNPNLTFVKATFATDGVIGSDGSLRIEPFLKGMAGAPQPFTIQGLSISFADMSPNSETVERFNQPDDVLAEARYTPHGVLKGLEYRIALKTQDPAKIFFPDRTPAVSTPVAIDSKPGSEGPNLWLFGLFALVSIAAGALVYFGMLRSGSNGRS